MKHHPSRFEFPRFTRKPSFLSRVGVNNAQNCGPSRGLKWTAASLALISMTMSAAAQVDSDGAWNIAGGGLWSAVANWENGAIANGTGFVADFGSKVDIINDVTVNLDSPRTIGGLNFSDNDITSAGSWILGNNGSVENVLTLVGTAASTIRVDQLGSGKTATISANIQSNTGFDKQGAGTLVLTGTNTFNDQILRVNEGTLTLTGANSAVNRLFVNGSSTLILEGNATLNTGSGGTPKHVSIGETGSDNATAILRGNATWTHTGNDFNISDVGTSQGSLTLSDNAALSALTIFVSKSNGTAATLTVAGNSTLSASGRLVVGEKAGSNGTLIQSGGSITVGGQTQISNAGGQSAVFTKSGGTFTANDYFVVGREGGKGVFNFTGGTLLKTGGNHVIVGDIAGSVGEMNMSDTADLSIDNELWVGNSSATGTLNVSGGTISVRSWMAVGRLGGTGTLNVSGGTITKEGNGGHHFIVGTNAGNGSSPLSTGTLNQTGGVVNVSAGETWLGENGVGTWNLSGGRLTASNVSIGRNGTGQGTFTISETGVMEAANISLGHFDTAKGILNLDGGTLRANFIEKGSGTAELNFNGSVVQARQNEADFLRNLSPAETEVEAGGLIFDSNGFAVSINTSLDGVGGLTKRGLGTLTLNGTNIYTGETKIEGGTLLVGNGSLAGEVSVLNGGTLGGLGSIAGEVTLQSGARIAPGDNSTGALGGTLTLQTGLELSANGGNTLEFGLGTTSDLIAITGGTFLGNGSGVTTIDITNVGGLAAGVYTLITWTNAQGVDLTDFQLGTLPEGFSGTLKLGPTPNSLQVDVVPEPSAAILLGVAGAGLLGMRRRQRVA